MYDIRLYLSNMSNKSEKVEGVDKGISIWKDFQEPEVSWKVIEFIILGGNKGNITSTTGKAVAEAVSIVAELTVTSSLYHHYLIPSQFHLCHNSKDYTSLLILNQS